MCWNKGPEEYDWHLGRTCKIDVAVDINLGI